jgi:predicted DNA-binding transcriptional regulator AlpA
MQHTAEKPQAVRDDEIDAGVYSFRDLLTLGYVKDRTDLHRKQRRYGFPLPLKLGARQAAFLRLRVHQWIRERIAVQQDRAPD